MKIAKVKACLRNGVLYMVNDLSFDALCVRPNVFFHQFPKFLITLLFALSNFEPAFMGAENW